MKKLLLGTAAVALAFTAAPAQAEIELDLGGFFKAYGVFADQDEAGTQSVQDFDMVRDAEFHFTGETTLDNGLTVGFHAEVEADDGPAAAESFNVEESYAYFSGAWGRVNVGAEDGAAFLLQVAAPSADANIDGVRHTIQPFNNTAFLDGNDAGAVTDANGVTQNLTGDLDYDQDISGQADKITYMTPVFNGFQAGFTYSTDDTDADTTLSGVNLDNDANEFGEVYEAAVRYEGQIDAVGFTVGAGYSHAELEATNNPITAGSFTDDREAWNVGLDLDIGPFGIGVAYQEDDRGEIRTATGGTVDDEEIFVVGVDYTTGPFKLGASYYNADNVKGIANAETDRYTGGVVYTYGPGMTFRGSVTHVEHEDVTVRAADGTTSVTDVDGTAVLLGTQIKF